MRDVTIRFGGIVALDHVSFDVAGGQIVGLIGPNGAGKTTLFNCLTRLYTPNSGSILFKGKEVLTARAHEIAGIGIARTFQNVELFMRMTVLENVLVGMHGLISGSRLYFLAAAVALPAVRAAEERARARALEILGYLGLGTIADRHVAGLPFGTLKAVELARALAAKPALLLLDEPAGGLNHDEVGALAGRIRSIHKDFDLTILVVEHHMNLVMAISDHVVVLDFGRKIAEGSPTQVQQNPAVIIAYLGADEDDDAKSAGLAGTP